VWAVSVDRLLANLAPTGGSSPDRSRASPPREEQLAALALMAAVAGGGLIMHDILRENAGFRRFRGHQRGARDGSGGKKLASGKISSVRHGVLALSRGASQAPAPGPRRLREKA